MANAPLLTLDMQCTGSSRLGKKCNATIPIKLTGTIIEIVKPAAINAPLLAVFPSFAENTLSIKSNATTSPKPSARIPPQTAKAPCSMLISPDRSRKPSGAEPRIVPKSTPEKPNAKKRNAAQKCSHC